MSRRVRGSKIVTTRVEFTRDPVSGIASGLTIQGEAADVKGQEVAYAAAGARTHFVQEEGFGYLEVNFGTGAADGTPEVPTNDWELDANIDQKDLFQHYNVVSSLTTMEIAEIKRVLGLTGSEQATAYNDLNAAQANIFDRYHRGETHYFQAPWVLRKIMTVSNTYQIAIALDGIFKVWTANDIINAEGSMYPWLATTIRNIDLSVIDGSAPVVDLTPAPINAQYQFGWLKMKPRVTGRWGPKVELTQEWWSETWDLEIRYQAV